MKRLLLNKIPIALIITLAAGAALAAEEEDLIAILRSKAGVPQKCAACQSLRIHGTVKSIPELAALLLEERVGHAARYALEAMPYPEAAAALRDALPKSSGPLKAGLVDSLGWRRDEASAPLLAPLLSDGNATVAAASATALGRIGGQDAFSALTAARKNSNPDVRTAVLEALLIYAESQMNGGDASEAASIFQDLYEAEVSSSIRIAAWRGWMLSDGERRRVQVVKALSGDDERLRPAAVKLLRETKDIKLVEASLRRWDSLPAEAQLAVLDAHLQFGADSLPTVRRAGRSPHLKVRAAAWRGLGDLSDVSLIPTLARAATQDESVEKEAARDALARMSGPGVRQALLDHLARTGPAEKAELIRALGIRGDETVAPVLLRSASAAEEPVRLAAFESLRRLAAPDTLLPLLGLAANPKSTSEHGEALKALYAVFQKCPNMEQAGRQVVETFRDCSAEERRKVLPLLARIATPEALAEAKKAARDNDSQLARESLRVLSQWPNAAPARFLFDFARGETNPSARTMAMRGGIATAGREPDLAARLAFLGKAFELAQTAEEKKMALSQLSRIARPEALDLAIRYLEQPGLMDEAAMASVAIAESLAAGNPELADEAARKILERCELPAAVKRAWALRVKSPAAGPFIRDWLVCGPYRQAGAVGAAALFDIAFGPEKPGKTVKWYAAPAGDTVNLAAFFPGRDNCAAYLKAEIIAPKAADAILLMGSDDGIKAWLNGKVVHSHNVDRGQVVDQDMAPVQLRKGANELLVKITQGGGGWSFCARIVGADGHPVEGLRVKSQTGAAPPVSASTPPLTYPAARVPRRAESMKTTGFETGRDLTTK